MQPILDSLKARLKAALARFAERKARQQAEGMKDEARGIVSNSLDFAQREPLRAATLALLALGLVWMILRRHAALDDTSLESAIS